jgi:hypothetical protein
MPKLLYLVTEDWFFVSHFLPMARTARAAGFDVVVATRVRDHAARIEAEGCRVVSLEGERRSLGPIEALRAFTRIVAIVRDERPDIVHCIALRMVALGGLAARWGGAKRLVLAPTGLGLLWSEDSVINRLARGALRVVIGRWLRGPDTRYLFENTDDPREFGLADAPEVTIVPGAGVDPAEFAPSPEPPAPPLKVAVVARMIEAKGIAHAVLRSSSIFTAHPIPRTAARARRTTCAAGRPNRAFAGRDAPPMSRRSGARIMSPCC